MENFPGPLWYMAWPYVYTTITCSPVISAQLGSPPPALEEIWCIPWYGLFDPFCHFQKARWNKWSLPIGHHLYSSGWRQTAYHHAKGKGFNERKILARWIRKKRHMDTHLLMQTCKGWGTVDCTLWLYKKTWVYPSTEQPWQQPCMQIKSGLKYHLSSSCVGTQTANSCDLVGSWIWTVGQRIWA